MVHADVDGDDDDDDDDKTLIHGRRRLGFGFVLSSCNLRTSNFTSLQGLLNL